MTRKQSREYYQQYYLKNKDRIKQRTGQYQREHREESNEKSREWARKNPERLKEIQKRYCDANKERIQLRRRKYYNDNRERLLFRGRSNQRMSNLKLKIEVLSFYGGGECRCCACGMKNIDCLSLDHINNNGFQHRKILRSNSIYRFAKNNGYPEGYQTLCMNCQWIKKAEHQRQRRLPSR